MTRGNNVNNRKMRVSFNNPATNVESRGMYERDSDWKVDEKVGCLCCMACFVL